MAAAASQQSGVAQKSPTRSRGEHDQLLDTPDLLIDELAQRPRPVAFLSSAMARAARQALRSSVGRRSAVTDRDRGSFLVFMFAFLQMIRHLTMLGAPLLASLDRNIDSI